MASTIYCLDEKMAAFGPKAAMQMCDIPPDEWVKASEYVTGRVAELHARGINLGEAPPPSTYAAQALAWEAAQEEMDRRAEIRSHHWQPHETVITQQLDPPTNPLPAKQPKPSDKIAKAR